MADGTSTPEPDDEATIRAFIDDVRSQPARNVVFAAPADDPRARRPGDAVRLLLATAVIAVVGSAYSAGNDVDARVVELFARDLPSWISAPLTVVFVLGAVYSISLLVAILLFGSGRAAIARDMFLAALLAAGGGVVTSLLAGPEWPDIIPELLERDGVPSFPVMRLAVTTALVRVADPYLALPMRHVGRRLYGGMVLAAIALGYGTPTAVVGGLAVGFGAAAAVHLAFGSGVGIPSLARIRAALATIGTDVVDAEYAADQPIGETLVRGRLATGEAVEVKVYGRDAADAAFATRTWRSLWYRDSHRAVSATGLQQVEHESLMLLEAERSGAPVPELIGWGPGDAGDALVVIRAADGAALGTLDAGRISADALAGCWDALGKLHVANIAHRDLDTTRIMVADDRVMLGGLSGATVSVDPLVRATDTAQMLVATAACVGADRAIEAARSAVGDDRLAEALPLVQASALSGALQRELKASGIKLKDLRAATTEAIDAEAPPLAQLARVTWGNVAMVVLTVFAASALISALSDIGLDTIADEVADASWAWIITAFVAAQLTNVGEWISLTGLVPRVPFGPTMRFRYAIAFISLAVPSDAGAITMNIRYMQKQGVPWAAAVAQGPLLTIVTKVFDVLLLVLSARVIGETVDLDDIDSGPILRLIVLVVVLVVLGVIITLAVGTLRRRVLPPIKEGFLAVRESVTDPRRLLRVASGTLLQRVLFGVALAASAHAYGGSISLVEAIFVNSVVSLFLGFMPVPGGIGVGEAALATGLAALGMPESAALAAAVTHRMVTTYLPPIYGWYTSRWLTENDYL